MYLHSKFGLSLAKQNAVHTAPARFDLPTRFGDVSLAQFHHALPFQ
jgi:hypothetical protein